MENGRTVTRRIETISHQLTPVQAESSIYPVLSASQLGIDPTQENYYDVIIIGGGIHGTATADALTRKKKKVLLLEQFEVNHEQGSSHGDGRIIRFAYPEAIYIEMAKLVYPMWQNIEERHGSKVTHITGGITFGPEDNEGLNSIINNLKAYGLPFEIMTPEEASKRFPTFRVPPGNKVVYERESGVAFASKAVKALWDLAAMQGATMLQKEKATQIQVVNDRRVIVNTQSGKQFTGTKLILTAGAWSPELFTQLDLQLPLVVTEEQVFYWKEKEANLRHHMTKMPIFIALGSQNFYGLPQIDIPGVKVGWHLSGTKIDVATKKKSPETEMKRETTVSDFVKQVLPDLAHDAPAHKLYCLYTTTPDEHFVIDTHPTYSNVIICSSCSGHGFKFGPIVGSLLAGLALGEKSPIPLDQFKISRFSRDKRN